MKIERPGRQSSLPQWNPLQTQGEELDDFKDWLHKARVERERAEAERREAEALPPQIVIYTVHGTFARGAAWTRRNSSLCSSLRKSLGWHAKIVPVLWSGANMVHARSAGAERLQRKLWRGMQAYPDADHFVIAHSHGGNVALSALSDETVARKIAGVLTLATPFLSAQVIRVKEFVDPGTMLFASLFAGWSVIFAGAYRGQGWGWWPYALATSAAMLGVLAGGAWLSFRMQRFAKRLAGQMPPTKLEQEQVAVIRVEGDEAIATLAGARFAGAAVRLLWRILTARVFEVLGNLLAAVDYAGWRKMGQDLEGRVTKYDDLPGKSLVNTGQDGTDAWAVMRQAIWQLAPILLLQVYQEASHVWQLVILGLIGLYGLPAIVAVLLVTLSVPISVLTSVSLLPCGWTVPFAGGYLHLTAEPSPPGGWMVHQFKSGQGKTGLDHSHAYQAPEVWSFAATWIKERTTKHRADQEEL